MKIIIGIMSLLLSPWVYAQEDQFRLLADPTPQYTQTYRYHHEPDQNQLGPRPAYPTQVVRVSGEITAQGIDCDEVSDKINDVFNDRISFTLFSYMTLVNCAYDPETGLATHFGISSYFDPLSEEAIKQLEAYKKEMDGQMLWNTPFVIESAQGLAVSLNIAAGTKESSSDFSMMVYRADRTNYYYASNYDFYQDMITDIKRRFYSSDRNIVLPFLAQWLFPYADRVYANILRASNYVDLQPERMFLMEKEPKIYTPGLKMYYAHSCFNNPNQRCL